MIPESTSTPRRSSRSSTPPNPSNNPFSEFTEEAKTLRDRALVEGIYQGAVQVAALREHGDLGLGTFESLDGELAVVDGHFFQVRSDGSVRAVQDKRAILKSY